MRTWTVRRLQADGINGCGFAIFCKDGPFDAMICDLNEIQESEAQFIVDACNEKEAREGDALETARTAFRNRTIVYPERG